MKNCWKVLILLQVCFFILICGCTGKNNHFSQNDWMRPNGKVKVLCTTAMCAELVMGVGGDAIDCLTLIRGESDPHSYQLVKGDDEKFARADLVFYSGLGLEHGPSLFHMLESNPKSYSIGDHIRTMRPESVLFVDKTVDPHIWMDVGLWREGIVYIEKILSSKVPEHAEEFAKRAALLSEDLSRADSHIRDQMALISADKRYLVSTHDAFNYFARAYLATDEERISNSWEDRACAPEGLAPDSQLSTADIQRLVDHLVRYHIGVVFAEANINRDSIKKLVDSARRSGLVIEIAKGPLYADSLGPARTDTATYVGMMLHDAHVIQEAWEKKR